MKRILVKTPFRYSRKTYDNDAFINTYDESEKLGTDFYDLDMKLVKTIPYKHNSGYFFASGNNTWHGLEKKRLKSREDVCKLTMLPSLLAGQ